MQALVQLARDLEWIGAEFALSTRRPGPDGEFEGDAQTRLVSTAEKIEREVINSVRFDPMRLVGVGAPVESTLDSVSDLLVAAEAVKKAALDAGPDLPSRIRSLSTQVKAYCDDLMSPAA